MMELENKISYKDFNCFCRFCLKQDFILKPIFKSGALQAATPANDDSDNIVHTILYCIGLEINVSDGLPEFLCTECLTNLKTLQIFKKKCISSEVYLKAIKLNYDHINNINMSSTAAIKPIIISTNTRVTRQSKAMKKHISSSPSPPRSSAIQSEPTSVNNDPDYINNYIKAELFDLNLSEQSLKVQIDGTNLTADRLGTQINNTDKNYSFEGEATQIKTSRQHLNNVDALSSKIEDLKKNIVNKDKQQAPPPIIPTPKRKRIRKKYKNKPRPPEICPICGIMQSSLSQHMVSHSDLKRFECEFCNKSFKYRDSLKDHLNVHTGERPYKCTECNKAFASASVLRAHKKTHTNDCQYSCHLCTRVYRFGNSLRQHVRAHLEDRRFKCEQCSKMFLSKNVLNNHYLIHTGERAFKCDICLKAFQTKTHLNVHFRVHTRDVKLKL